MRIQSLPPHQPPARPTKEPRPGPPEAEEIGRDKTHSQHLGNATFGLASVLGTVGNIQRLTKITRSSPIGRLVPGINLVAAGIEGVNAAHKYHAGEKVVALTSAGNSVGCLSGFLSESSLLALNLKHTGLSSALAAGGGVLGLVAGGVEVRQGLQLKKQTGSSRTLAMGVLDLTSGSVSLTGAALISRHQALGLTLLIGSGVIDMAGIAVDYLWASPKKA